MEYLKKYKTFNESKYSEELPDYFFLVLRDKIGAFESLATMEAKGLLGISSTPNIINHWLDVRPILLMMPAKETLEINNIYPVDYYNPDQLVSKNLFLLRRLTDNYDKGSKADLETEEDKARFYKYEYDSTLTKIFQVRKLSVGKKKQSRLSGTWHREPTYYQKDLFHTFSSSEFYYKIGDYIADKIYNKEIVINSVNDLVKAMEKGIIANRESLENLTYGSKKKFEWFFNYFDKYGTKGFKQVLNWMIVELSRVWAEKENEWIVKKDKLSGERVFKIPSNSHLIIKTFPGYDKEEEFKKWQEKKIIRDKESGRRDLSHGMVEEDAIEAVKDYQLNNIYNIHYVENLHEAKDLVNKLK